VVYLLNLCVLSEIRDEPDEIGMVFDSVFGRDEFALNIFQIPGRKEIKPSMG